MKRLKIIVPSFLGIIALACLITAFSPEPTIDRNYVEYIPVFMTRADLEKSVFYSNQNRELVETGKIYTKGDYIYVNERYKGVHVINNNDPYHPLNEGFISAPGCIDMAVKGDVMYLDNAVDLVAFDLNSKEVKKRVVAVFPEPISPNNMQYNLIDRPKDFILVGWKKNPNFK